MIARESRRSRLCRRGVARGLCAAAALASIGHAASAAAAQRTFVASTGHDAAPCSRTLPCRSFAAAISQTNDRGEIVVLDSAGYGAVTVTKSVTIVAPPGVYAGISVFANTDGVTVNAPSGEVVLRGLKITGQGGNHGIDFVQGSQLRIERCDIGGMGQSGLHASLAPGAALYVRDTTLSHNGGAAALFVSGAGRASLEHVEVSGNAGTGILIEDGPDAALRELAVARNGLGGIELRADTLATTISIDASRVYLNGAEGIGVLADAAVAVTATIADTDVVDNNQAAFVPSGGVVVQANGAGTGTATVSLARSNSSFNRGAGVLALNPGATIRVDACTVTDNTGYGIAAASGAAAYTRLTSTVENNAAGDTSNVSPYAGD
jgi:hypothetical protein